MRTQIIVLQFIFWASFSVFGQDTLSLKFNTAQFNTELDIEASLVSNFIIQHSDTAYYNSGEIMSISFYPKMKNKIESGLISYFEVKKKVFQFDKCGNLRNITVISKYIGPIESCHDYYFNNPYQIKDNIIENVECDELWVKPLLF